MEVGQAASETRQLGSREPGRFCCPTGCVEQGPQRHQTGCSKPFLEEDASG